MKETVIVNAGQKKSVIDRNIYGHFSEHLGRCIYGGFWVGKDSPIDNINGYRKDVVEAFKELDIPNLRWPGGCFADEYHWKDGIGDYKQRKRMVNTHWGGVLEDNSFGTHEFMELCELLECKPYICGNVGSGTVQEMSEWIEYITFSGESPMAKLREENGRKDSWKLDFFGVGNENWGCGGNMSAEFYADQYKRYQTYVRQYGSDKIYKIAGGANVADYHWTEVLMREAASFMDGLSLHCYCYEIDWNNKRSATNFDNKGWYTTLKNAFKMDELIINHDRIMTKFDPDKRVGLVVDEWGCWHEVEPGTNPGFLYQQNTVRDALVAGITLNIFNNHSDRVKIANLAQAVNVLQSPILTEGDKLVKTPTFHVLKMYKQHQDATLLETTAAYVSAGIDDVFVPGISVSASEKAGKYFVTLCNTDMNSSKNVDVHFAGLSKNITSVNAEVLTGEKMNSFNTFDNPDVVVTKALRTEISQDGKSFSLTLPAHSVSAIAINC
ncbi:MAG: alpha-N-arabinofuranosidase [Treponema sp.]|jgi:alpha-N-arabinofuranosidase|nr:alpha-N-arabinofuranosidase [Treponema sp.]